MQRIKIIGAMGALLLTAAACSSTTTITSGDAGSVATTSIDTTAPGATTASTEAATTTTTPVAEQLLLRSDGLGALDFGTDATTVVDAVTALLGAPARDGSLSYPIVEGSSYYYEETPTIRVRFTAPEGRTACWSTSPAPVSPQSRGLCLEFGGADAASLTFTGWTYRTDAPGLLHSQSNATIGSRWADVPSITMDGGRCYSMGYGHVDGIWIEMKSSGVPFVEYDSSGNRIEHTPDPADVTITDMETGDIPMVMIDNC